MYSLCGEVMAIFVSCLHESFISPFHVSLSQGKTPAAQRLRCLNALKIWVNKFYTVSGAIHEYLALPVVSVPHYTYATDAEFDI